MIEVRGEEVYVSLERLSMCCLVVESSSRLGVTFADNLFPQTPEQAKPLNRPAGRISLRAEGASFGLIKNPLRKFLNAALKRKSGAKA